MQVSRGTWRHGAVAVFLGFFAAAVTFAAAPRAAYEPGWKWSLHVGPLVGAMRCEIEHVGMVVSGVATVAFEDGRVIELTPGKLFYVPPVPHDSWVVGSEPYVSLHFLGAQEYARNQR